MIVVTKHAIQRGKERLSFNQSTLERMAIKAFETGIKHSDTKGALKKYVDYLYLRRKTANNIRIYGEIVYMFAHTTLLTVHKVPNHLKNQIHGNTSRLLGSKDNASKHKESN